MSQFEYSVPIADARTKEDMIRIASEWKAMPEEERVKVRSKSSAVGMRHPNPTRINIHK
jgi:hypothetical protein